MLFSINIFKELLKLDDTFIYLIVGDGPEREKIVSTINSESLQDSVLLVGNKNNVSEYMSAFDALILPSIFESFGIVLIEGQISGLHCFASDIIPDDVAISDRLHFFDLNSSSSLVASQIMSFIKFSNQRITNEKEYAKFSSRNTAFDLLKQYEEIIKK